MKTNKLYFGLFEKNSPQPVAFVSWNQVIRDVRKAMGFTQTQLGKKVGVSLQQVSRFEAGTSEPPIDFWKKFSNAFGLNIEWLLFGTGPARKEDYDDPAILKLIPTKDIELELKDRTKVVESLRRKAEQITADHIKNGSDITYANMRKSLNKELEKIVPSDAPQWLKDDLSDIFLGEKP